MKTLLTKTNDWNWEGFADRINSSTKFLLSQWLFNLIFKGTLYKTFILKNKTNLQTMLSIII